MTTTNTSAGGGTTDRQDDAPFFPAPRPPQLCDPGPAAELVLPVIRALAEIVDPAGPDPAGPDPAGPDPAGPDSAGPDSAGPDSAGPDSAGPDPARPTPCTRYTVAELRDHVLGWLQFFTAAFADPTAAAGPRPDPLAYRAATDPAASLREIVLACADTLDRAIADGVLDGRVRLSQSWMDAPAALGMVLGEYLVHGWDLARAQGLPWQPSDRACEVAREFFDGMVLPEYRGGDDGFFDQEVPVAADAPALDRLIGFAGRDPQWRPPA